jgi:hypothetical protein
VADVHFRSQWQVALATDPGFTSPVYDSGESNDLLSHAILTTLDYNTPYLWRVRFRYTETGFTPYSGATVFRTELELLLQVRVTGDGEERVTGDLDQRIILTV